MVRSILEGWGSELDDRALVKAYAMMGVFSANHHNRATNPPREAIAEFASESFAAGTEHPVAFDCSSGLYRSPLFAGLRPGELAETWDRFTGKYGEVRLDLRTNLNRAAEQWDPRTIARGLALPGCSIGSTFFGVRPTAAVQSLHWPICIGLLPGSESERLHREYIGLVRDSRTVARLTREIDPSTNLRAVDMLVFPGSISDLLGRLENLLFPLRARIVIAMAPIQSEWEGAAAARKRISELTGAGAVLEIPATSLAWLHDLIVELSHDYPLDKAFTAVRVDKNWPVAGLWSSHQFLDNSRPTRFLQNVAARARRYIPSGTRVSLHPDTAARLGADTHDVQIGSILNDLEFRVANQGYFRESDGATMGADIADAVENVLSQPEMREAMLEREPRTPRHLQAEVFVDDMRQTWDAFVANCEHHVKVTIGPPTKGAIELENPFDEGLLPPTEDGAHMLTITFFEPSSMDRPRVSTTLLTRTGRTAPCRFTFRVQPGTEVVEARVTVLHENRVIQTAVLTGPVLEIESAVFPKEAPEEPGIHLALTVVVPHADFSERPRFDAALVLNHVNGEPYLTANRGTQGWAIRLGRTDAYQLRDKFAELLECKWHLSSFNGLRAVGTTSLLIALARHGRLLRTTLVEGSNMDVSGIHKLQAVVVPRGERLPLEFLYDFPSPEDNAVMCPHAEEALETGKCCGKCDQLPTPASIFCPLGFWLFNRVLEWHIYDEHLVERTGGADFLLEIAEARRPAPIEIPGKPLVGYSKRVEQILNSDLPSFSIDSLRAKYPNAHVVDSWSQWKSAIRDTRPSVLVLLTHTARGTKESPPAIELGPPDAIAGKYDATLPLDYLTDEYISPSRDSTSPIVFLLGCKTDIATDPLSKVSAIFQAKRAAIVITTNSDVYGQLAGRIAETCLDYLGRFSSAEESFGDIMLRVRRRLLLDGVSMVLCVSAYGDADWKLCPSASVSH